MLGHLWDGLVLMLNWGSLLAVLIGLVAGIVVGALPGLTATMAVAILAPFTFFMRPEIGIPFLLAIFKSAVWAGSISAITIATPGTAAAAAVTLDGHALARQGQTRRALEMSLYASVTGDMLATLGLIAAATWLASVALRFAPPEFVVLYIVALLTIATVAGRSFGKAMLATGAGFLVAMVGLDPMSGQSRFTFGSYELAGGISFIPLLIGLFALGEVLATSERAAQRQAAAIAARKGEPHLSLREYLANAPTMLRSTGVGFFIGILPGIGAEIACWLAYGLGRRFAKDPKTYGKGNIQGVAAAESGANAACPGDLIPMLVFGIPGDTVTAVLLGAFMAQGLTPGPMLFEKHAVLVYGLFAMLLVSNVMLLGIGMVAIRFARGITAIPNTVLHPIVIACAFAGSFAVNSSAFDLVVTALGGVLGWLMRRADVPVAPMVIAMLCAPGLENALRQTLLLSDGDLAIFVERPVSGGMLAVLAGVVLTLAILRLRRRSIIPKEASA